MVIFGQNRYAVAPDIPRYTDFEGMRRAGRLAARTLDHITPLVKPGVTTLALDQACEEFIRDHAAIPAPLGYKGYPKAICASINHVVCHGIPDKTVLKSGDIVNIDVTVILDGWYGDTSRMFFVGDRVSSQARRLVEATYEAMMVGIAKVEPGRALGAVGETIQERAEARGFSVVRDFCGHGLGREFHQPPTVLHYQTSAATPILRPGMAFTIEPMINVGGYEVKILSDGWTAVTKDNSLSAQFEHSVGVTEQGVEIFTLSPAGYTRPPYRV